MNKDYTYCPGQRCPLAGECKRYLPVPPEDEMLWWTSPGYHTEKGDCPVYDPKEKEETE